MTPEAVLAAYEHPAVLAEQAAARRDALFGRSVCVRSSEALSPPAAAARVDASGVQLLDAWPEASALRPGDRVIVHVDPTGEARQRFAGWLQTVSMAPVEWSVAPFSRDAAGVHRLWCIAAARLLLPATVRVEVRHDLLGLRLAQLALGFGADTLAGPVEPDRKLPLAGLPRPTESTATALLTLVRQTGLEPGELPHA
jgi:hypothetical protein